MKPALIAAFLSLAMVPLTARAADLTINFSGAFKRGTCAFTVADVDLGSYKATLFTGAFTTPLKPVVVNASSCTSDIATIHMKFDGTADSNDSQYFAVNNVTGNVSGVGVELVDGANQTVVPNTTTLDWSIGSTGLSYTLNARFAQTLPVVTSGSISTPITIQFTYN